MGFVGITLTLLYALTGNLFASILWHILFDVRFSFGTPKIEGTIQQQAAGDGVSPNLMDGGEPRPGPGKWHSRQQRRLQRQQEWKELPHGQEDEESIMLDKLAIPPGSEKLLIMDTPLAREDVAQIGALTTRSESEKASHADLSPISPTKPARGRAAREQLLRDMGGIE